MHGTMWDTEMLLKRLHFPSRTLHLRLGNKAFIQHTLAGWLPSTGTVRAGGTSRGRPCGAGKEASLEMSHAERGQGLGEKSRAGEGSDAGEQERDGQVPTKLRGQWEGSLKAPWCCAFKATESYIGWRGKPVFISRMASLPSWSADVFLWDLVWSSF